METHFRIINDELLQQRTQDYDYCTDRRGSVDPAVISEVIQEAEAYTRAAGEQAQGPKPPIRTRIGAVALKGFEMFGKSFYSI